MKKPGKLLEASGLSGNAGKILDMMHNNGIGSTLGDFALAADTMEKMVRGDLDAPVPHTTAVSLAKDLNALAGKYRKA